MAIFQPKESEKLLASAEKSPTFYTGTPSKADISSDKRIRSAKEKERISGANKRPATPEKEPKDYSMFERGLQALGAPVAIGSALLSKAIGQGQDTTASGLSKAIEDYHSYGDVIRKAGGGNAVGFAGGIVLDIALDPVNWLTAGTTAIVPRVGAGMVKGGVKGAAVAAKSGLLQKASKVAEITSPTYRKLMTGEVAQTAKNPTYIDRLFTATAESTAEFDEIVKQSTLSKVLSKPESERLIPTEVLANKAVEAMRLGDEAREGLSRAVIYSPIRKTAEDMADELKNRDKWLTDGDISVAEGRNNMPVNAHAESLSSRVSDGMVGAIDTIKAKVKYQTSPEAVTAGVASEVVANHMASQKVIEALDSIALRFEAKDPELSDMLRQWEPERQLEAQKFMDTYSTYATGMDWYDRRLARALTNKFARETLSGYGKAIAVFRPAMLAGNPASIFNSYAGNVAFAMLAGINVGAHGFTSSVKKSMRFLYLNDLSKLQELLGSDGILMMAEKYPKTFRSVFGVDPLLVTDRRSFFDKLAEALESSDAGSEAADQIRKLSGEMDELAYDEFLKRGYKDQATKLATKSATTILGDDPSMSFVVNEVNVGVASRMVKNMRDSASKAGAEGKFARAFMALYQSPMELYGKGDQVFKIATMSHLVNNGVSEAEMLKLARRYPFITEESLTKTGNMWYKLDAETAMRVVDDIYMNYSAMPGFVKMMRSLPLAGNTFFSFCRDEKTEILTKSGWKWWSELKIGEPVMSMNTDTGALEWKELEAVNVFPSLGSVFSVKDGFLDYVMTPNHRCVTARYESDGWKYDVKTANDMTDGDSLVTGSDVGYVEETELDITDEEIERVGRSFSKNGCSLSMSLVTSLSRRQMEVLYAACVSGGSVRGWVSHDSTGSFQALCLMTGRSSRIVTARKSCLGTVEVTERNQRKASDIKTEVIQYEGTVWCPKVKDNGTWVARTNGAVDITGNSYGFGAKGLAALQTNPAAFTKMNLAMREFGGAQSPQEREELEGEYYSYMDEPSMMKIPFFQKYPLYLNMANALPQYSFSLLANPKRNYGEGWGDDVMKVVDRSQLFRDPFGSWLFTYVIAPHLMSEAQTAVGTPLYPEDASTAKKTGMAATALGESFIPRAPQMILGKIPGMPYSSDEVIDYLPSLMRGDQHTLKGRSAQGYAKNFPNVTEDMLLRLSRQLGIPLHKMNIYEK
ncbi:MAG: hypothetical protein WC455_10645 [Dehalococcoidia bacterium]|jgi:hypothetical protein